VKKKRLNLPLIARANCIVSFAAPGGFLEE
jgi:hypothetical protein